MKKHLTVPLLLLISFNLFAQVPDSSLQYFKKGMEEKAAKRYLLASGYFDDAIRVYPAYTDAYVENGLVNLEMRRTDAAKNNFTKAYELDSGNETAIKQLTELYFSYRQYQQAIEFAEKCKTCENAGRIIALSYYQLEDYAKAEIRLLALLEKDPADAEITYTSGRNYLEMGLEQKAIPYYIKAVQLDESKSTWMLDRKSVV